MPSSDIIIIGWITRRKAKIILNDFEGFIEAFFMAVDAKTYEQESYVVHRKIVAINA